MLRAASLALESSPPPTWPELSNRKRRQSFRLSFLPRPHEGNLRKANEALVVLINYPQL